MVTVMAWERYVHYRRGILVDVLEPGRHRFWTVGHDFVPVDMRSRRLSIAPQEVPTSDGVSVKITASIGLRVVDPVAFVQQTIDPIATVYDAAKTALRTVVRGLAFDDLVAGIQPVGVPEVMTSAAGTVGLEIESFEIRDVIIPAQVRRATEVLITTRQHAQIALEEARGQSAVLRHLANTAKVLEDHPALAALKLVEAAGQSGGSVIIERPAKS